MSFFAKISDAPESKNAEGLNLTVSWEANIEISTLTLTAVRLVN